MLTGTCTNFSLFVFHFSLSLGESSKIFYKLKYFEKIIPKIRQMCE
jgi:hypothetical protein